VTLVVDASAILAVLLGEDDSDTYRAALGLSDQIWISPVNWWEVQARLRVVLPAQLADVAEAWRTAQQIEIAPISEAQTRIAIEALSRFRSRPARLNLGDCFAYALAKSKDAPLLFKGNDFLATDVKRV
jgi:ribonuclease VapC